MIDIEKLLFTEICDFIENHYKHLNRVSIESLVWHHLFYETIDVVSLDNKIVACVLWNVSESGLFFDVTDLIINKGEESVAIMKNFIARNWSRFPTVKYIRFSRVFKYKNRIPRVYSIKKILKLRG